MKIHEVSESTGLSTYTLRYYEQAELVPRIDRKPNGHRDYTADDVLRIGFVTRLRAGGMPIADIKRYMDLAQRGDATIRERLELLEEHRGCIQRKIDELRGHLDVIGRKIEHYRASHRKKLARAPRRAG